MADALYNNARHIRGYANEKVMPANVAGEIKAGDFLVMASNKVVRVSSMADAGTLAQNQAAAKAVFAGVAIDQKRAGETRSILVACGPCVFKYPCNTGNVGDVGAFVGIEGTGAGLAVGMADQMVVLVATATLAIGKLAKAVATGDTVMEVEIASVLGTVFSGPQAAV